jgi:TRAP-type C4-dicarboxylate transport system permease small subunit
VDRRGFRPAIAAFVAAALTQGSFANLQRAWRSGADTPELKIPVWFGIDCVTFGLGMLFLRLLVQLLEPARLIASPAAPSHIFAPAFDLGSE